MTRNKDGTFVKGNPGRKKGSLGKFTTLKQSFLDAFNSKEYGGAQGLVDIFTSNAITKREFAKLISRMLPTDISMDIDGDLTLTIKRDITKEKPKE